MPHVIEAATSGRARCRGCGARIAAGTLRFGERLPNPYADDGGEMTIWFHLACAAYRRPGPLVEVLETSLESIDGRARLEHDARLGLAHRRLPRINTAERAPSGRARCRACREPIGKGVWRVSLVYYEGDGRFVPSGFIHARCAPAYVETPDLLERIRHFSPGLTDEDSREIQAELES